MREESTEVWCERVSNSTSKERLEEGCVVLCDAAATTHHSIRGVQALTGTSQD